MPCYRSKFAANDRVSSLLERLNINDRTLNGNNVKKLSRFLESSICWDVVDNNLNKLRKDSLDYLLSSIDEHSH